MSLVSHDFWDFYMIEFLQQEHLDVGSSLVHTLKNGDRKVYKKDVKAENPFSKDALAEFTEKHPRVLDEYKTIQGDKPPLNLSEIYNNFNERTYAGALKATLPTIPPGDKDAGRYHSFIMGVCTFLFYPNLICPIKEQEIHEGRKRIDIKYTNSAESGFFQTMLQSPQARSLSIPMECKNYTKKLQNPEMDQLSGRFSHHRGHLGFLLCRNMDDRTRIIARCRDTAADGRGFMIVLEDTDIVQMLELVEAGNRSGIDRMLHQRFDEITH